MVMTNGRLGALGALPELMVRLGNIMIRPIVLFACQIWGVIIIIIKRRSGINPIPPTVIDRD